MTKNDLCQEKSAFRNSFTIDDFGLENGNNMVRISVVSGSTLGCYDPCMKLLTTSAKIIQDCQLKSTIFSQNPRNNINIEILHQEFCKIRPQTLTFQPPLKAKTANSSLENTRDYISVSDNIANLFRSVSALMAENI